MFLGKCRYEFVQDGVAADFEDQRTFGRSPSWPGPRNEAVWPFGSWRPFGPQRAKWRVSTRAEIIRTRRPEIFRPRQAEWSSRPEYRHDQHNGIARRIAEGPRPE